MTHDLTPGTRNARHDAEQHLDDVETHLRQLRALVAAGVVEPVSGQASPDQAASPAPSADSRMVETFGRWVLDLLGLGDTDASEAVQRARSQLISALSKGVGHGDDVRAETHARQADDDADFVDVFAGDNLEEDPDEELGVRPISLEA